MKKYKILIHGIGYEIFDEDNNPVAGFYVSVFIEATHDGEACQRAIDFFINSELYKTTFLPDKCPDGVLQVESIDKLYSFDNVPYPMSGMVFYKDSDQADVPTLVH